MIVSQRFVWGHVPKTGGDATATMIARVPRLVLLADHLGDHAKHLSFDDRRGSIKGKLLVANIRRLPDWAISVEHLRAYGGIWPDFEPLGPQPAHVVASRDDADRALAMVVGDYEVDRWLRQEHLTDDLLDFLRKIATLTAAEERAIRSVGLVNVHRPRFRRWRRRSSKRFFTPAQIDELYANNPRWAAIERRVYG
ncbi:MAG: hypothetical protein ACJ760_11485 [Thermoleophilaceae bacterium]